MEQTSSPPTPLRAWKDYTPAIDRHLPTWARRSDPIVRRHLGIYWKILPLETDLILRLYLFQVGLVAVSVFLPVLLPMMFIMLPVSLVLLPFLLFAYGRVLVYVGIFTTRMMVDEQRNNTLNLLRTTPLPLRHILFSKAAAGVWRQVEDMSLVLLGGVALFMPFIGLQYWSTWPFEDALIASRVVLVLGLAVALMRLILEPFMIAALAVLFGALVPQRTPALISLLAAGFFYFLLINMPRLLPLSPLLIIVVDFVLPVVLPLVVIWASFRLALYILRRD